MNSVEHNQIVIPNSMDEKNINGGGNYSSDFEDSSGESEVDEIFENGKNDLEVVDIVSIIFVSIVSLLCSIFVCFLILWLICSLNP